MESWNQKKGLVQRVLCYMSMGGLLLKWIDVNDEIILLSVVIVDPSVTETILGLVNLCFCTRELI